jgi:hypothetical protein
VYGDGRGPDSGQTSAAGSAGPDPAYSGGEVVPHEAETIVIRPGEPLEPVQVEVRLPVPVSAPTPPGTMVVRRRTLLYLILILLVLLVLLALLVYAKVIRPQTASATASATSSASAGTSASPSPTAAATTPAPGASTPAGTPTASPAASGAAGSGAAVPPGGTFSPPNGSQDLGNPVDGGVNYPMDVAINAVDYPDSVTFGCSTSGLIDWNVAGFATFEAYVGIPDNAQNATGVTDELVFKDENGKTLDTVKTAIGQPQQVSFSIAGVDRLAVSCVQQGATSSNGNVVALGTASMSN